MPLCCYKQSKKCKIHPNEKAPTSILKNRRKSIYVGNLEPIKPIGKKNVSLNRRDTMKKNKDELMKRKEQEREFQEKFCAEILQCGICLEKFNLGQNKIISECAGCNIFLHCGIAGKCVGEDCSCIVDGKKESLTYCIRCVNPYLKVNLKDNGQCLCKKCETSGKINKSLLLV